MTQNGPSHFHARAALLGGALLFTACDAGGAAHARTPVEQASPQADWRKAVQVPPALGALEVQAPHSPQGVARIACATCHGIAGDKAALPTSTAQMGVMHRGLTVKHGDLACAACHDKNEVQLLHLADGTTVPMEDAIQLCGQCHGTQLRDYRHGAHGGMRGYWDEERGERQRNHCVDCHAPHAPAIGQFTPLPPPIDRGGSRNGHE